MSFIISHIVNGKMAHNSWTKFRNYDHSDLGQLEPGTVFFNTSCTMGYLAKPAAFVSGIPVEILVWNSIAICFTDIILTRIVKED